MLIWRGNGLAVPILAFGPLLAMDFITSKQNGPGYYASHVWPKLLGFAIAAVAILLIGGAILSFAVTDAAPAAQPPVKEASQVATAPAPEAAPSNPPSASYAQASQIPTPAVTTRAAEPPPEPVRQFAQVYADSVSKTYFPEPCRPRPSNAVRLAKSAALLQGYVLSPKCAD
jgi:hypothetical protein